MNKGQQELLNEAYKNYSKKMMYHPVENWLDDGNGEKTYRQLSQEEFIYDCKTDLEFSEKWGLTIEERELSLDEKEWELEKTNCINDIETDRIIYGHEWEKYIQEQYEGIESTQGIKIPTKLITITYNDKTIESYE
jgi:hypothetical protein